MDTLAKGPVETAVVDAPKGKLIVPAIAPSGPSVRLSIVLPKRLFESLSHERALRQV
jgi:hypothetical protein